MRFIRTHSFAGAEETHSLSANCYFQTTGGIGPHGCIPSRCFSTASRRSAVAVKMCIESTRNDSHPVNDSVYMSPVAFTP